MSASRTRIIDKRQSFNETVQTGRLQSNALAIASSVFTEHERCVIESWVSNPTAQATPGSSIENALDVLGFHDIRMCQFSLVSAAVAQIALAAVEDQLPQWALVSGDDITLGRDVRSEKVRYRRRVQLRPRFLFSLDWAASAPGISWPRDYYATWIPGYAIWMVTASSDTKDLWGVCDVAVGWFNDARAFHDGVRDVVIGHWRRDEWLEPDGAWEYFWEAGLVSEEEALGWRHLVWPRAVEDEGEVTEAID